MPKKTPSRRIISVRVRCLTCGTVQTKAFFADELDSYAKYSIMCIKCETVREAVVVKWKFVFR